MVSWPESGQIAPMCEKVYALGRASYRLPHWLKEGTHAGLTLKQILCIGGLLQKRDPQTR